MSEPVAPPQVSPTPSAPRTAWLGLVVCAVVIAVGIGLIAAQAPSRIRLLGLFPVALGVITALLLARLATLLELRLGPGADWLAGLATAGELALLLGLSVPAAPKAASLPPHPIASVVEAELKKTHPELLEPAAPEPSLRQTLRQRLERTPFGGFSSPVPELIWGSEVLAGSFAAAMALRMLRQSRPAGASPEKSRA